MLRNLWNETLKTSIKLICVIIKSMSVNICDNMIEIR